MHDAAREAWELVSAQIWGDETFNRFHAACDDLGLSPPMLKAMMSLVPGEARPMRSMAEDLRCDASWVTSLIDGLEEKGYVERRVLPADRRVKTIVLTLDGEVAQKQAHAILHAPPAAFEKLTVTEARQLLALLKKATS